MELINYLKLVQHPFLGEHRQLYWCGMEWTIPSLRLRHLKTMKNNNAI